MKRVLFRRNRNVLLWLGILPLVLAVVAYETSSQHVRSVQETLTTDDFIQKLDELLSTVQDAETGQRGYLLTGQERYLTPFDAAKSSLAEKRSDVDQAAARSGVPAPQMADLDRLIEEKMAELQLTVDLRRNNDFRAAIRVVESNQGQQYMTRIRGLIAGLKNRQAAVFQQRLQLQRRRQFQLNVVLGLGVTLGFVLVFLAYRTGAMYARERDRVEEEIRGLNERLEARVRERTAELEARRRELEVSSLDLQRSNADLSQFAYVAGHDLQEPLRTIASYMGLLARRYQGTLDETADKYMQYAIDGATRMQALIHDLLSYSQAGTQPLERQRVSSEAVLQNALQNLKAAIEESSALVHYDALPMIEADETKLTQVMQNLIGNSIKFRKPDARPEITIAAKKTASEWIFEIEDNGIGFDPNDHDRIFQVFQRLQGMGDYPGNGSAWRFAAA